MEERDFIKMLGKIGATMGVDGEEFAAKIDEIFRLLEEADMDDYYGSEGYKHRLGWD